MKCVSVPNVAPDDLKEAHDVVLLDRLAALDFAEKREQTAPSNTGCLFSSQPGTQPLQAANLL